MHRAHTEIVTTNTARSNIYVFSAERPPNSTNKKKFRQIKMVGLAHRSMIPQICEECELRTVSRKKRKTKNGIFTACACRARWRRSQRIFGSPFFHSISMRKKKKNRNNNSTSFRFRFFLPLVRSFDLCVVFVGGVRNSLRILISEIFVSVWSRECEHINAVAAVQPTTYIRNPHVHEFYEWNTYAALLCNQIIS